MATAAFYTLGKPQISLAGKDGVICGMVPFVGMQIFISRNCYKTNIILSDPNQTQTYNISALINLRNQHMY